MHVTVVIVTYSNRYHLIKQVLDSCFNANIDKVIIVDNDSEKQSKEQLKSYSKNFKNKIDIIWNSSNLGSAKAYKQGLKRAYKLDSEYIWLLDDDNKPRINSLKTLKNFWKIKPNDVAVLLSFRPDRQQYKQAIQTNNSELVLSAKNSFSGFHYYDKLTNFFKTKKSVNSTIKFGEIAYAPYGGMFFHKSILDTIGYPDENFFLYSDDHDWSYRITKASKKIYLVLESVIDDIDTSWAIKEKGSVFKKIKTAPSLRVYYSVRNRMLFEKKYLISNHMVYNINRLLFGFFVSIYSFKHENLKVFFRAMKDAKNNNLAKF